MIIASKKTTAKRGRPSYRSVTLRRSDSHIIFSAKAVNDLGLCKGMLVNIISDNKDMYICTNVENGYKLFGYMNGLKYTTLSITAKEAVKTALDSVNAAKVGTFLIAANSEVINGYKCHKIISTPLRID